MSFFIYIFSSTKYINIISLRRFLYWPIYLYNLLNDNRCTEHWRKYEQIQITFGIELFMSEVLLVIPSKVKKKTKRIQNGGAKFISEK